MMGAHLFVAQLIDSERLVGLYQRAKTTQMFGSNVNQQRTMIFLVLTLTVSLAATACGKKGSGTNNGSNNGTIANNGSNNASNNGSNNGANNGADMGTEDMPVIERAPLECDALNDGACALPWPSNLYLEPDDARTTGYTLTFGSRSLPANRMMVNVEPAPFARMDGYSLGSPIVAVFPSVDETLLPDEADIAGSLADDAHMVLLKVAPNGDAERVPYWVDLDKQEADPAKRAVIAHPAVILDEATRYVVAFRGLTDTNGEPIPRSAAFQALVDGETATDRELFFRQERFDDIFSILEGQGVAKQDLTLAWDFVTASSDALHGRMLHMIDDALATTGESGPPMTITEIDEFTVAENEYIAVEMRGTIEVPHYMRFFRGVEVAPDAAQRWELNFDESGVPQQNGTRTAKFWIRIPHTALDGTPHGLVLYGHGQLGSGEQVAGSFNSKIASDHGLIFYAADLIGMSEDEDDEAALEIVQDFNNFPLMGDRLHQGMLEWVLLARAMRERFGDLMETTSRNIVLNRDEMFYSGISQGGIFGPTFVALSPDVDRGHLGVPGQTYSLLLHRSANFNQFFDAMKGAYPDSRDQVVLLSLAQLLWDGTDPVSYYGHIAQNPFPGRNSKGVLLTPAKGDYQVAVITTETVARSDNGVGLLENYDDERTVDLVTAVAYPHDGSGVVLYDFGDDWPGPGNHTPFPYVGMCQSSADCDEADGWFCDDNQCSHDPHGKPRRQDHHNQQLVDFLRTGVINDVCGGDGCHPD